jgi:hypothetical protein
MLISLHMQATTTPKNMSCDPGEQRTGLAGRAALRDLGADGVEVAQSRRCPRPEPHAAPVADDADPGAVQTAI